MNEYLIARPYAYAVFEIAKEDNAIQEWEMFLQEVLGIYKSEEGHKVLSNPQILIEDKLNLFNNSISKMNIFGKGESFLTILLKNTKLFFIYHILKLYREFVNEFYKKLNVEVITATLLSDEIRSKVEKTLLQKYNLEYINVEYKIDPNIIGGMIVKSKHETIDGSIIKQLEKMKDIIT